MTWPHRHSDWASILPEAERVYIELCRHITHYEDVVICARDQDHCDHIRQLLEHSAVKMRRIHIYSIPTNDTWTRDYGPLTVLKNGKCTLLNFTFNGWGGKFANDLDNQVTDRLHALGGFGSVPLQTIDLVLEGGSIDFDGDASMLTTSRCLLTPTRNPHLGRERIESSLMEIFGIERLLWLDHGMLLGDDTDSHVDVLARFCDRETIAYTSCDDRKQGHYDELRQMEAELDSFRTAEGKPYHLVPLPVPAPKYDADGTQLPASYANFLIINGAVLVPVYEDDNDAIALERLGACFPGRDIIGINCLPLITQHGSLHCITMQLFTGISATRQDTR